MTKASYKEVTKKYHDLIYLGLYQDGLAARE